MMYSWVTDVYTWITDPNHADQEKEGKINFIRSAKEGKPSQLTAVGISNTTIRTYAKTMAKKLKDQQFSDIIKGTTYLWVTYPLEESRIFCCAFLNNWKNQFTEELWAVIDKEWIPLIDYWTNCDNLCIDVVAHFPVDQSFYYHQLQHWISDANFWRKRVALLAFLWKIRKDTASVPLYLALLNKVLTEQSYYIRKTIPWTLREASKSNPFLILEFIEQNRQYLTKSEIKEAKKYISQK